jgi:hypothetical protein
VTSRSGLGSRSWSSAASPDHLLWDAFVFVATEGLALDLNKA